MSVSRDKWTLHRFPIVIQSLLHLANIYLYGITLLVTGITISVCSLHIHMSYRRSGTFGGH